MSWVAGFRLSSGQVLVIPKFGFYSNAAGHHVSSHIGNMDHGNYATIHVERALALEQLNVYQMDLLIVSKTKKKQCHENVIPSLARCLLGL